MNRKLETDLKTISAERSQAIRHAMAQLKARNMRVPRALIADLVGRLMMYQRFGWPTDKQMLAHAADSFRKSLGPTGLRRLRKHLDGGAQHP